MFAKNERLRYDSVHDILYIYFGEPRMGYEDEVSPGIFIRRADDNDEVIGITIMNYQKTDKNNIDNYIPDSINMYKYHVKELLN